MTLKEMADEYHLEAARLTVKINHMIADGATVNDFDLKHLIRVRQEIRNIAWTISGYYEVPRGIGISARGWEKKKRHKGNTYGA